MDRWLESCASSRRARGQTHGASRRDETPGWIADKQKRLAKIREAREALEEPHQAARRKPKPKVRGENASAENRTGGPVLARPRKEPDPKVQRNLPILTCVLLTKDGFIQGYNAQAAVDGAKQIIAAHDRRR